MVAQAWKRSTKVKCVPMDLIGDKWSNIVGRRKKLCSLIILDQITLAAVKKIQIH